MWAKLGNISAKEGYHVEVDPADYDAETLKAKAFEWGVTDVDDEGNAVPPKGTKEQIAARMSAQTFYRPVNAEGTQVTTFSFAEDVSPLEAVQIVVGQWVTHHSDDPPEWVESDNDGVATMLAAEFGAKIGRPKGFTVEGEDRVQ